MMKTKQLTLVAILLLLLGNFTACSSDNDSVSFTEYSLNKPQYWNLDYEGNGNVVVVNSDEELKNIFTDTEYPSINFSKHTLVLISGTTNYGIHKKMIKDIQNHSENRYKLNVEITLTIATVMERWVIPVLIEKVSDKSVVEADVAII